MSARSRHWLSSTAAMSAVIFSTLSPALVQAHGYISEPASRSKMCATGVNNNCGAIQWEPQSVEGPDRYPLSGPDDGNIASAGNAAFSPLDVQTSSRWSKTAIAGGPLNIEWTFTAPHVSRDFRYFITKPDWNPNQPLTRSSFSSDPFCTHDGRQQKPANPLQHDCYLPANLRGYHVLLGVWDVGDTVNSFYQVVDVNIIQGNQPEWLDIGDISPGRKLMKGDKATLQLFDNQQQIDAHTWQYDGQGDWNKNFAEWINQRSIGVHAGVVDSTGNIVAVDGHNDILVASDSAFKRAEISFETQQPAPIELALNNLQDSYNLDGNKFTLNLDFTSQQVLSLDISLYHQQQLVARSSGNLMQQLQLPITLDSPLPGDYELIVAARRENISKQFSYRFTLTSESSDYDYIYPNQVSDYAAGVRVLAQDGRIYQCKPYPYAGWCRIYNKSDPAYAPGVGRAWQDAWLLIGQ